MTWTLTGSRSSPASRVATRTGVTVTALEKVVSASSRAPVMGTLYTAGSRRREHATHLELARDPRRRPALACGHGDPLVPRVRHRRAGSPLGQSSRSGAG